MVWTKAKDIVKKDPRLMLDGKSFLTYQKRQCQLFMIQYFYNYLKPTGRAGFVMAIASDAGHSEKDIREKLENQMHDGYWQQLFLYTFIALYCRQRKRKSDL